MQEFSTNSGVAQNTQQISLTCLLTDYLVCVAISIVF